MSIESGRIAMNPQSVMVDYLMTKSFLMIFQLDSPPPLSGTITREMIDNRKCVRAGSVVNWDAHGNVAVVQDEGGNKGAFWCYELNELARA
jgi:hypothetical protein